MFYLTVGLTGFNQFDVKFIFKFDLFEKNVLWLLLSKFFKNMILVVGLEKYWIIRSLEVLNLFVEYDGLPFPSSVCIDNYAGLVDFTTLPRTPLIWRLCCCIDYSVLIIIPNIKP